MRNIKIIIDDVLVAELERRSIHQPLSNAAFADRGDGLAWTCWASTLGIDVEAKAHHEAKADRWDLYRQRPWERGLPSHEEAVGLDVLMREIFNMRIDLARLEALRAQDESDCVQAQEIMAHGFATAGRRVN